jgi:hypothetical protein
MSGVAISPAVIEKIKKYAVTVSLSYKKSVMK